MLHTERGTQICNIKHRILFKFHAISVVGNH